MPSALAFNIEFTLSEFYLIFEMVSRMIMLFACLRTMGVPSQSSYLTHEENHSELAKTSTYQGLKRDESELGAGANHFIKYLPIRNSLFKGGVGTFFSFRFST